jgi:hypothetical protein
MKMSKIAWRRESILDVYNLVLALFLFITPWLFAFGNRSARIDLWATSAVIVVVSIAAIAVFSLWEEWLIAVLGVWLIVSPWVVGFTHTRAMHYSIAIGAAVVLIALTEVLILFDAATSSPNSPGDIQRG